MSGQHKLPHYLQTKLQRVEKCPASFVKNGYANVTDVIKLGWLPVKERNEFHLLRATNKEMYDVHWPSYLPLQKRENIRRLRSNAIPQLIVPLLRALVCKNQTYRGKGGKFDFFLILMLDRLDYN